MVLSDALNLYWQNAVTDVHLLVLIQDGWVQSADELALKTHLNSTLMELERVHEVLYLSSNRYRACACVPVMVLCNRQHACNRGHAPFQSCAVTMMPSCTLLVLLLLLAA
jgi:hypothetical protein